MIFYWMQLMHYVLAIQITVQKFGNNRLVKYVHGFVSELIGREIRVVIFTNLRLGTLRLEIFF